MSRIAGWFAVAVIALAVIVYGSFALYEGSWSLASHNLNHSLQLQRQNANGQAQNAQAGWNYQTMLGQQIVQGIDDVNHDTTSLDQYQAAGNSTMVTDEKGQRAYDAGQVCYKVSQVNGVLPKEDPNTHWVDINCSGGVLSPSSVYYVK